MNVLTNALSISARSGIRFVAVLGILFCLIGLAGIVFSIIELFYGRPSVYHYDESQGGLKIENPLWPSSGKGFWVGLIWIATGLVGILASREWTPPSIVGFTGLAGASTVLSFYLIITCIIPVQYDTKYSDLTRPRWQVIELTLNSLLLVVGIVGIIIGAVSTIIGSYFANCCISHRKKYLGDNYEPNRIIIVRPERNQT